MLKSQKSVQYQKQCSVSKTLHKISSRNKNNFGHVSKRSNHPLNPGAQKHCFNGLYVEFHVFLISLQPKKEVNVPNGVLSLQ